MVVDPVATAVEVRIGLPLLSTQWQQLRVLLLAAALGGAISARWWRAAGPLSVVHS